MLFMSIQRQRWLRTRVSIFVISRMAPESTGSPSAEPGMKTKQTTAAWRPVLERNM